jgi:sulfide:quinone oxidoreductase
MQLKMKRVVAVGSGSGGTLTANLLAHALRNEIRHGEATVVIVGDNPNHAFQPASLDIAFKGASPSSFVKPEEDLLREGVRFVQDPAVRIDLKERAVMTRSGARLDYDYLVIATGAVADPTGIPGLKEGSLNFHTGPHEARRIWETLQNFAGGKVVVAIAGTPHKCPPSPNEAAFMLDAFFKHRGMRDRVEISFLTPYPRAYPAEKISEVVTPLFERDHIDITPFFNVDSVDPATRKIFSLEGEEFKYDLLIAVPPHHGADVVLKSEIGDEEGWIPANRDTMVVTGYDDAFAIGDATAIPISKSGVVAHLQSIVVADNILCEMSGSSERLRYNGRINCPMEVGDHRGIFVSATYTSPPVDQKPSMVKYIMKKSFARIYWRTLNGSLERVFDVFFGKTRFPLQNQPEAGSVAAVSAPQGQS